MDPKLAALLQMIAGRPGGPAAGGLPQGGPPMPAPPLGAGGPGAAQAGPMPAAGGGVAPPRVVGGGTPIGSMGPPQAAPGALMSAAGMMPPNDANLPARRGDMMGPAAPTTDEPTTPRGMMIRNELPQFARTPLGALLIPQLISGGGIG